MKVDNQDLTQLATEYGSTLKDFNWNPNCDIDLDGVVSILDLFHLGKNIGKP